jgi:hypothetical protein
MSVVYLQPRIVPGEIVLANLRPSALGMSTTLSLLFLSVCHIFFTPLVTHHDNYMGSHPFVRLLPHIGRRSGEVLECSPA